VKGEGVRGECRTSVSYAFMKIEIQNPFKLFKARRRDKKRVIEGVI
jgi:hypothetical protein